MSSSGFQKRGFGPHGARFSGPSSSGNSNDGSRSNNRSYQRSYDPSRRNDRPPSEIWTNPPIFQYNHQNWQNNANNNNTAGRNNTGRFRGNPQQYRGNYQGRGNGRGSYARPGGFRFSNGRGNNQSHGPFSWRFPQNDKQEEPSPPLLGSEEERRQKITDAVDELKRKLMCNDGSTNEDANLWEDDCSIPGGDSEENRDFVKGIPELKHGPPELDLTPNDLKDIGRVYIESAKTTEQCDNDNDLCEIIHEQKNDNVKVFSEVTINDSVDSEINSNSFSSCDKDEKLLKSDKVLSSSKSEESKKVDEKTSEESIKEKSSDDEKYKRRDKSSRKINSDSLDILKKDERKEKMGSASPGSISPFVKSNPNSNFSRESSGKKRYSRGSSQSFTPPLINTGNILQPPPAFDPRIRTDDVSMPQMLHESSWMYTQMPPISMMPPMSLPPMDYGYVPPMAPFAPMAYPPVPDYGPPPPMSHPPSLDQVPLPSTNPLDSAQPGENEALNELRKAMEFAEEIMFMSGNKDEKGAEDCVHDFPTLPDLPPVQVHPPLPAAPSTTEKSSKPTKKGSKKREKRETVHKPMGPHPEPVINAIDIPIPGESPRTPPRSPQEEARRKVAFNLTPKFKKIDTSNWTNVTSSVKSTPLSKLDTSSSENKREASKNPSTSQAPQIPKKQNIPMDIMDFVKTIKFENPQFSPSVCEKSYTPDPIESPMPSISKKPSPTTSSWKERVIGRFLKMSKNDIQNMINHSNLRKFDIAMQHLVKEKKSSLAIEMRNTEDERIKNLNNSYDKDDFIHQLKAILDPAATVDISDLPTNFIHQLNEVLQLDVTTSDKELFNEIEFHKFNQEQMNTTEIDHMQVNESSQNIETNAPAITSDMPKSRKIDNRTSKDTTKNPGTVVDKPIQNIRKRNKRDNINEIKNNKIHTNSPTELTKTSDNKDTLIMDELDDIFTAGIRTKTITKSHFSNLPNSRFNSIPNYDVNNQGSSAVSRIETPIIERVDSIFNAGISKAKGSLKSPLRNEEQRISRGRKNSSDFDVFRNLTKEEYDAKYGESSHSSYENPYRIMNPKHSRKHGDYVNGENYGMDDSGNQMSKSRFSRSPSRHSHNTLEHSDSADDDGDEDSDDDSETSTSGSSSNDSSDEPSIDVSKMLRFIKEREKIAKKKSINEEIRDEVTAEIERKRREKKAHREHKAKLRKKDKRKRDKKGKKRKNRKKKKRRSHYSDDHHEERSHALSEREIKKEGVDKEDILAPVIRKKIIGPKSVMAKAALLEKEALKEALKPSSPKSPVQCSPNSYNSQNNQSLKTKAQLKQMPDAVKKNSDKFGAVQVSKHSSEGFKKNIEPFKALNAEQASEFLKKSAERVETLMLPRQSKNNQKSEVIATPGQLSVRPGLGSHFSVNNLIKTASQSKLSEDEVKKSPKKLDLKSYKERTLLHRLRAEGKLPQENPRSIISEIMKNSNITTRETNELIKVPITKELKAPVILSDFRILSKSEINAQSFNFDSKSIVNEGKNLPIVEEKRQEEIIEKKLIIDVPRASAPGPKCIKRRKMSVDVSKRGMEVSAPMPDKLILHAERVENFIEERRYSEWNHHFRFDRNAISDGLPDTVPVERIFHSKIEEFIPETENIEICDDNSELKIEESENNEELPKLDPEMVKKSLQNAEENPLNSEKAMESLNSIEQTCEDIPEPDEEPNILRAEEPLDLEKSESPTIAPGPQLPDHVEPSEASEALLVDAKSPDQPESSESFLPNTIKSSAPGENLEETFANEIPNSQEVEKLSSDIYSASEKLRESIIDKETDDLASFREDEAKWRAESDIQNEGDQKDEDQVSFTESHSTNWQLASERKNVVLHDRALVVDTPRNSLLDDPIAFATSNNSPTTEADEYGMLCENEDIPGSIYENQLAENSPIDIDDVPIRGSFTPDYEIPGKLNNDNTLESHVTIADKDLMEVGRNMSPDRLPSPILQDPEPSILDDNEEIPKVPEETVDEEVNMERECMNEEIIEKKSEVEDCHPPELEEVHEKNEEIGPCDFSKGEERGELAEEREMPQLTVAEEKSSVIDDVPIQKEVEKDENTLEVPKPEEKRIEDDKKEKESLDKPKDRHSKNKPSDPLKKLNKSSIKDHKKQKHHHDKKKTKITEARIEEAIKSNIVTEISKPTTKNAVMARMREIDIAIQNLMNEKMTLYQMLQNDEWPSQIEAEEVIEQKTKSRSTPSHQEKKKPENKGKEAETVPSKSVIPEAPPRDLKSSKTTRIEEKRPPSWEDKVPHKSAKKRAHSKEESDPMKPKEPRREESNEARKEKSRSKNPEDSKKPVKLSQILARDFKPKPSVPRKKSISPNCEDKNTKIKSGSTVKPDNESEDKKKKKNDEHQALFYSDDSTLDSFDRSNDQKRATGLALLEESMKREAIVKRMKDSSKKSKESTPDDEDIDMSKLNLKKKHVQKKGNNKKSIEVVGTKTKKHVHEVIEAVAKNRIDALYKGDGNKKIEKSGKLLEGQRRRSAEEIRDLFSVEPTVQIKSQKKLEAKGPSDDDADDKRGKVTSLETAASNNEKNEDIKRRQIDLEKDKKIKKERIEEERSSSSVRNEILQDWTDSSSNSSVENKMKQKLIEKSLKHKQEKGKIIKELEKKSEKSKSIKSTEKSKISIRDEEKSRVPPKIREDDSPIEGDDEDEEMSFRKRERSNKNLKMSSRRSNKSSSRSRSRSKQVIRSSSRDSSPELERPKKRPRSGSSTSSINSRRKLPAQSDNKRRIQNFTRLREEMKPCRVNLVDCKYLLDLRPELQMQAFKKFGITRINSWRTPKYDLLSHEKSRSEDSMIVIEADDNLGSSSAIEIIESGVDLEEDNVSEKSACLGFPTPPRLEESLKSSAGDVLIVEDKEDVEVIDIKEEPLSIETEIPKSTNDDPDAKETRLLNEAENDQSDRDDNELDRMRYTVHKGPILDIKVFGDSFLAASEDGAIYRYSQKSNGILNIYQGHEAAVTCLYVHEVPGISESKKWYLFSGSLDASLRCYDVIGGSLNRPVVTVGSPIQCMDQAWGSIFIGTKSGHISRYDIKSASLREDKLDFSDKPVLALRASTEGMRKVLIVASRNQPITIRDAQNGLFLRTISGQRTHTVYSLMKDKDLVYCGTSSTSIPVFDFINGEQVTQYTAGVGIVCMRLYRQLLFAGCYDGNIYVFDTKEPKLICSIPGPGNMLLSMEIVEHTIIAGSKDRRLHAWAMPPQVRTILHDRT